MAKTSIIKETRDILKEAVPTAKKHWGDPPDGQVPVNDSGWYTSPNLQHADKGVDPRDCEQWPSSPYCGGNPWTKTPVWLDVDWGVGKCGAWVEVEPTFLFTKLPPMSVGYRPPGECREEEKPVREPDPIEDLPDEWKDIQADTLPNGFRPDDIVVAATTTTRYYLEARIVNGKRLTNTSYYQGYIDEVSSPTSVTAASPPGSIYFPPATALVSGRYHWTRSTTANLANYVYGIDQPPISETFTRSFAIHPNHPKQGENGGWFEGNSGALGGKGDYIGIGSTQVNEGIMCAVYYGKFGDIFSRPTLPFSVGISPDGVNAGLYKVNLAYLKKISGSPDHHPPPPNQTKKKKCCMQCCSGGNQQANKQNQDNAEILRLLRKIDKNIGGFPFKAEIFDANDNKQGAQAKTVNVTSVANGQKLIVGEQEKTLKAVGINEFPIYAPSSIVKDESHGFLGDLGDLKNKVFKQRIESIAELLNWKIKNDHEVHGQWQDYIEIQDSDPTQKGNQPKKIVLPNMARSFRELVLLNSIQIKTTGIILDTVLKLYIDIANTKVTTATTEAIVRDIQDFLDYPTVEKNLDVPLGIKIPADNDSPDDKEDLNRFLSPSHVKAKFDDWTGEGSIHDMLVVLLDAASMIKATFYNKA